MGHGQGSQKTRLRRLKSIELLTKSLEFLAGGAWLPLLRNQKISLPAGAWPALSENASAYLLIQ